MDKLISTPADNWLALGLKPGVIYGQDLQTLYAFLKKNNRAIPAVNCVNTDSINAALEAAEKVSSPIIIQISYGGSRYFIGRGCPVSDEEAPILGAIAAARYVHEVSPAYNIPVIIHTDHASKDLLPWVDALIAEGERQYAQTGKPLFSSHMVDLSEEKLSENIAISRHYLKRLTRLEMTLEVEVGCTGGEEDGVDNSNIDNSLLYTSVKDIAHAYHQLSEISNNFLIAAAFGNVHGVYRADRVKLQPKILNQCQEFVSETFYLPPKTLSFVFHGGSGSSQKDIQESVEYGVVKMNIDTDTQWSTWAGVKSYIEENRPFLQTQVGNPLGSGFPNKKYYDPRMLVRQGQLSTISYLESLYKVLGH